MPELDAALFNSAIKMATSAILTTGGLLNGAQFYQATRLMGPAASAQTVQGYLASTTEILASMGNRGARGLQDAAPLLIGGSMNGAQMHTLERLGLLNPQNVQYTGGGRYLTDTTNMAGGALLAKGDIVDWLHSVFLPAAAALGLNPLQAGATLTKPLAGVVSFLGSNWAQIVRSGQQQAQAAGTDQYSVAMGSLSGATLNFQTALFGTPGSPGGLMQALGVPAAGMAVTVLNRITGSVRNFTEFLGAHPAYAVVIDKTLLALGVGLTVLGGAAVVAGVAAMVGTGGYIALAATGLAGLGLALHTFPNALGAAEKAVQHFLYDVTHPFSAAVAGSIYGPPSSPGAPSGSRFTPRNQSGPAGSLHIEDALHAIANWIDQGAPTNATVTNPRDIGNAALKRVSSALTAPSTGTSGTNLRLTPSGGAGLAILGHN